MDAKPKSRTLPAMLIAMALGVGSGVVGYQRFDRPPEPAPVVLSLSVPQLANLCNAETDSWQTPISLRGDLELAAPITCTKPFILNGNGYTIRGAGIHLKAGASWSTIRDLRLIGTGAGVGIDIEAHGIRLQNIRVQNWETGIRAWSTGPSTSNANGQFWQALWVDGCTTGIHIDGSDANAGIIQGLESRNNDVHFFDSSQTGQTVIGGIADGNGVFHKVDHPSNYGTYVGVYTEGDPPGLERYELTGYQLIVGGSMGKWSGPYWGRSTVDGGGRSNLGFRGSRGPGIAGDLTVWIPGGPDSALRAEHLGEPGVNWHIHKWIPGWNSYTYALNGGGTVAMMVSGNTHPAGPAHVTVTE